MPAQQGALNGEWRSFGGDPGNTKYSPLDQINRDNFEDLEIAWRWESISQGVVAANSNMLLRAEKAGTVRYADARRIQVDEEEYKLTKFRGLNERTCQSHKPVVVEGQMVAKGELLADGAGTKSGELALGKNVQLLFRR